MRLWNISFFGGHWDEAVCRGGGGGGSVEILDDVRLQNSYFDHAHQTAFARAWQSN